MHIRIFTCKYTQTQRCTGKYTHTYIHAHTHTHTSPRKHYPITPSHSHAIIPDAVDTSKALKGLIESIEVTVKGRATTKVDRNDGKTNVTYRQKETLFREVVTVYTQDPRSPHMVCVCVCAYFNAFSGVCMYVCVRASLPRLCVYVCACVSFARTHTYRQKENLFREVVTVYTQDPRSPHMVRVSLCVRLLRISPPPLSHLQTARFTVLESMGMISKTY